jgi:LuxR family maltose regulon positive regulatory protein
MSESSVRLRPASGAGSAIIRSKLAPPTIADDLVLRPRLSDLIAGLLEDHRFLAVFAAPGAGKTTAVQLALRDRRSRFAWLTVDGTDVAPGRLLAYLEAALGSLVPEVAGVATRALAAGEPREVAAGLLVEAAAGAGGVLVLDELERLADSPDALSVIGALLRYAPPDLKLVLVSRRELKLDIGATTFMSMATVGEADLAFTVEEAAEALAASGASDAEPRTVCEVTEGWVAGVLFEGRRSGEHVARIDGEADPLHGYLSSQILDRLASPDRDFLTVTAVLDRITADRAVALGLPDAAERLASLRLQCLPATWSGDGGELRCHTCFREYLLEVLRRRGERRMRALRTANSRLLVQEGHPEDAIEELLAVDAVSEARPLIEQTIATVIERPDHAVAARWLAAVDPRHASVAIDMAVAELIVAIGQQQFLRGAGVGDRLNAAGTRDELARSSGSAACMLAWCYWHVGQLDDARAVVDAAGLCPEQPILRYLLSLCFDDLADPPPPPALTGGPLDSLIFRLLWAHGRLDKLRQVPTPRRAAGIAQPQRIRGLLAIGQTDQADQLSNGQVIGHGWFDVMASVELLAENGRHEQAWERLQAGRSLIPPTGSAVLEMLSRLLEARLHIGLGQDQSAVDQLDSLEAFPHLRSYRFIVELADTWRGLALLRNQRPDAVEVLRRAVRSMGAGDRILELPRAAAYLAEAEWRAGEEDASDEAARLALETAERQGSTHRLLQALGDVPAVAARGIDAESDPGASWHELGRVLISDPRGTAHADAAEVELHDFGRLEIVVGGTSVRTRIRKSAELLAFLVSEGKPTVPRRRLLNVLFDGRDDPSTRAYLRQAMQQLRAALPASVGFSITRIELRVPGISAVSADSLRFERLLALANRQAAEKRLASLQRALETVSDGEYLPEVVSEWAQERRRLLRGAIVEARVAAADLLFHHGKYHDASRMIDEAVEDDPYSERAWRLRIQLANAVGDDDRVLDAFRRCRTHLQELGLEPSAETVQLVERLR